jgi:DNA-3-methyladenine glycosylase
MDRAALDQPAVEAARAILGATLVHEDARGRRTGRIVEVEAYDGPEDLASHARAGRTTRNAVMFGRPGIAYVYLVYGMHDCLNVVTGPAGSASALLIRAVAPTDGIELMRADRLAWLAVHRRAIAPDAAAREAARLARLPDARLASGPGLVGAAFAIDRSATGLDLCDPASPLRLEGPLGSVPDDAIATGPRVGVAYAGPPWADMPWRFVVAGDPSVSGRPPRG